ncbi:NERD domain-containing protein [Luteolibacter pohnpeiensis]|uniref:NERD domain-containing protein n=1 Tax=Luteolibacter pohnpeiensis TaxID=454153 RepID=A0A934SBY9_9BACT|nr:nuclease-related domain-containing protein [Luteolibacter pohnpeiensis]MBK1883362.1 NERD domain-containing protein [Luteolibacter pohnpeiensis]
MKLGMIVGVVWIGAALGLIHFGFKRMFARERAKSRAPFTEKMLRPAGESLRLKIENLVEEMMDMALRFAVTMVATGWLIMLFSSQIWWVNGLIWSFFMLLGGGMMWRSWRKLAKLRTDLRNCRLGFHGERYVAEKLSMLQAQGYRVFHDFIFDMKPGGEATTFNIDHIVVGPTGVFAVETKAWRKPNGELPDGNQSHKLKVSGDTIQLPDGKPHRKATAQAKRNADEFSKWLAGSSARAVKVVPVVAMPGWYVTDDGTSSVAVLSGSPIGKRLPSLGVAGALSVAEVERIADRIEAHSRNVEL